MIAVIPARFASTRFPGKMLADLAGEPLVLRTWRNTLLCKTVERVIVATDDERIASIIHEAGGEAVMTDPELPSGTDRINQAISELEADIVVNVQGDEPMLPAELVDNTVALLLNNPEADAATAATPLRVEEYTDPNVVKITCTEQNKALYFSRAPIPYSRDSEMPEDLALRHIGLYVYRRNTLTRFCSLPPSPLEECERLEQLRLLEDGGTMLVHIAQNAGPGGIDTPTDLERVRQVLTTP
ncbi:MAG TPA: 3-deoxy-manno-octulosonate cytidylyltransferase [Bacteroidetes bacterium]|nr:3-deoxy-manno-octulosonate cytidylyltransferase [Bacteroidota bacterium]HEX05121.1 3-deoxy-manno-octulosonate cytidylyltransferase [Bacteroidota bacterium]